MTETRYVVPSIAHPDDWPITGEIKGEYFVAPGVGRLPSDMPRTAAEARKEAIHELKRSAAFDPEAQALLNDLVQRQQVDAKVAITANCTTIDQCRNELAIIEEALDAEKVAFEKQTAALKAAEAERVRQLKDQMVEQMAAVTSKHGEQVATVKAEHDKEMASSKAAHNARVRSLQEQEHVAEERVLHAALEAAAWKLQPAAVLLGIPHMSLTRLLQNEHRDVGMALAVQRKARKASR